MLRYFAENSSCVRTWPSFPEHNNSSAAENPPPHESTNPSDNIHAEYSRITFTIPAIPAPQVPPMTIYRHINSTVKAEASRADSEG